MNHRSGSNSFTVFSEENARKSWPCPGERSGLTSRSHPARKYERHGSGPTSTDADKGPPPGMAFLFWSQTFFVGMMAR